MTLLLVYNAGCPARCEVTPDDVSATYDFARDIHLNTCVRALSQDERMTLGIIAEINRGTSPHMTSGAVYEIVKESLGIGFTVYFEHLKKLDEMRLNTLTQGRVRGNTREIALRYDSDRVVEAYDKGK